ncbi:Glutenin [Entamoeba marina]
MTSLIQPTQRFLSYGQKFSSYEPIISFHCFNCVSKLGGSTDQISSQQNSLKVYLSNVINDTAFQVEYIKEFVKKNYAIAQQVYHENPEASKDHFLFVVDMIDLLSTITTITPDIQSVRSFIVSSHFIPNSAQLMNIQSSNQQQTQNMFPSQQQSKFPPPPNQQQPYQPPQPPQQQGMFPTPSQQHNMFPTPSNSQHQSHQQPQPQGMFPTPSQQPQQFQQPIKQQNLFPSPNQQPNYSQQPTQPSFPTSTSSTNVVDTTPKSEMNQNIQQPITSIVKQPPTYTPSPVNQTNNNPILQKPTKLKEDISQVDIITAWGLCNKAKDAMLIGDQDRAKARIQEALERLEEN